MRWLNQHKTFFVAFAGTFALIVGLLSGVLTLVGAHFTVGTTVLCLIFASLLTIAIHWSRLRPAQIPAEIISDPAERSRRKICCPCTFELSCEVAALAKACFGSETIQIERYEQLRVKNPNILVCLLDGRGNFAGYFDVVPLDEPFGTLFMGGKLGEKDLTHEHVLGPGDMRFTGFIYLSGIAARDASSIVGMQNASILVWSTLKYLEHFYGGSIATAFASAVTADGERLLQRLGFTLHSEAHTRTDGHSLYAIELTRPLIQTCLLGLPDYSGMVELPWNSPQVVPTRFPATPRGNRPSGQHSWPRTGTEGGLRRIK